MYLVTFHHCSLGIGGRETAEWDTQSHLASQHIVRLHCLYLMPPYEIKFDLDENYDKEVNI